MNAEQTQMARLALGLTVSGVPYRNFYRISADAPAMAPWLEMVAEGDAILDAVGDEPRRMHTFKLTRRGASKVLCEGDNPCSDALFPSGGKHPAQPSPSLSGPVIEFCARKIELMARDYAAHEAGLLQRAADLLREEATKIALLACAERLNGDNP